MNKTLILLFFIVSNSLTFGQDKISTVFKVAVPFAVIEKAPIYPGCNITDNRALKKCTSERISTFVSSNFNRKSIDSLGLPPNRYHVSVQFKIDTLGNVVNLSARASHPLIEKEAIRVVSSLPKFTPGEQNGAPVGVLYVIPIQFEVVPKNNKEDYKEK
ncbi:MAG: energy transducer TonB [Flavobacteriaceae bacterium]